MLRLLRKGLGLLKAHYLQATRFQRIILACAGVHLVLFFAICFIQADDHLHVMVQGASAARVVCVPSFMLPTKSTRTARSARKKRVQPKKINKKLVRKRKPAQTKKPTMLQKNAQEKIKKEKKVLQKKVPEPVVELPEPIEEQEELIIPEPTAAEPEPETPLELEDDSDVIYVNSDTYQMLEVAKALQEAIGHHWAPPVGMPAQTRCQVRVTLSSDGKASDLELVEKSGIAVFDMAARTALLAADYPKSVWGKTMVVHFNEEFA